MVMDIGCVSNLRILKGNAGTVKTNNNMYSIRTITHVSIIVKIMLMNESKKESTIMVVNNNNYRNTARDADSEAGSEPPQKRTSNSFKRFCRGCSSYCACCSRDGDYGELNPSVILSAIFIVHNPRALNPALDNANQSANAMPPHPFLQGRVAPHFCAPARERADPVQRRAAGSPRV